MLQLLVVILLPKELHTVALCRPVQVPSSAATSKSIQAPSPSATSKSVQVRSLAATSKSVQFPSPRPKPPPPNPVDSSGRWHHRRAPRSSNRARRFRSTTVGGRGMQMDGRAAHGQMWQHFLRPRRPGSGRGAEEQKGWAYEQQRREVEEAPDV
jgi:hypothetical protein